ncbi:hypothetical protein HN018_22115 (plasmid) [Lichenicola cladoniae]|uniref:Uncharacterized protein n=1 Tax=Lichenicola cladoniae TaxID=1484109 RepID=A0A6M8HWK1_9PROT|nr:hypothetical protein [Lichenicola cladoniae]NPD69843.1 hypothetical protein [Acetobacteraceae bacterium]QKE92923.1 hypothetical protein HN018_22115 [Lichenicola cladoniae]
MSIQSLREPSRYQHGIVDFNGLLEEGLPPPAVQRAIKTGVASSRMVFPADGSVKMLEFWKPVPVEEGSELTEIETYLSSLEAHLAPATRWDLLGRLLALMSHFRSDPHPPEVEARIADDWAEDLGSFPMWAVEEAARRWRRTKRFRPQICEMVDLCEIICADRVQERDRLRSVVDVSRAVRNPLITRVQAIARMSIKKL